MELLRSFGRHSGMGIEPAPSDGKTTSIYVATSPMTWFGLRARKVWIDDALGGAA
jgi:hypothetical protein